MYVPTYLFLNLNIVYFLLYRDIQLFFFHIDHSRKIIYNKKCGKFNKILDLTEFIGPYNINT